MENPCLTFIISSILESDEFLVIDVIHEVAHSWFGNAVTNATWEEMWLSEGLATYAQRRITTETYGAAGAGEGSHWGPWALSQGQKAQPGSPAMLQVPTPPASPDSPYTPSPLPCLRTPSRCCLHLPGDCLPPGCPAPADEASGRGQPGQQTAGQAGARYLLLRTRSWNRGCHPSRPPCLSFVCAGCGFSVPYCAWTPAKAKLRAPRLGKASPGSHSHRHLPGSEHRSQWRVSPQSSPRGAQGVSTRLDM